MKSTISFVKAILMAVLLAALTGCGGGSGGTSTTTIIKPRTQPETQLGAPQDLQITQIDSQSITISWQQVSGASGYKIYLNGSFIESLPASTTVYNFKGLNSATAYEIGVSAVDTTGKESPRSLLSALTNQKTLVLDGSSTVMVPDLVTGIEYWVVTKPALWIEPFDGMHNPAGSQILVTDSAGFYAQKILMIPGTDLLQLYAVKATDPSRPETSELFTFTINKKTGQVTGPFSVAKGTFMCFHDATAVPGHDFSIVAYETGNYSFHYRAVSTSGQVLDVYDLGVYNPDRLQSDGNYLYIQGTLERVGDHRIFSGRMDLNLKNFVIEKQETNADNYPTLDFVDGATMTPQGSIYVSAILNTRIDGTEQCELALLKINPAEGKLQKISTSGFTGLSRMTSDPAGNLYGIASASNFRDFLRKYDQNGNMLLQSNEPIHNWQATSMVYANDKIYIFYKDEDAQTMYKPHTIEIFDANTLKRLQPYGVIK